MASRLLTYGLAICILLLISLPSAAIHQGSTADKKWLPHAQSMSHPLDQPVNDGTDHPFLMNLGPTGIRAWIKPETPKQFEVRFVFQDSHSPAKGKINVGDHIVGANGKMFREPHKFHRKKGGRGWPGPPFELAGHIENSQGSDGKLSLIVWPKGNKSGQKTVDIQLKPVGRFSDTWPWDCDRSDQLLDDLLDFMLDEGNISKMKRHHYIQALLAVWASGDKRAIPLVKSKAESLMKSRPDFKSGGMGQTWMAGYNGILLGEYYNAFKDNGVKTAAEAFAPFYEYAQFGNGSYGHRSAISFIATGRKPYASMAAAGGICMLAQSTFKANGLAYSEVAYEKAHLGHLRSAGNNSGGGIAYGFAGEKQGQKPTDHAVLVLESSKGLKEPKPRPWWPELGGKGLPIEGGLKAVGKYTVEWPHPKDHRWRDGCIDWLDKEKDKVTINWSGGEGNKVTAWRYLPDVVVKEPTKPYNTTPDGAGHQAGSAPGALAHFIGNKDNKSWGYLGKHMANGCALSPKMLWDGHADAVIHSFFGALAAFRADEKSLRSWLDYTKTWIILSETHEPRAKGGLVDQPFGCQRNATASIARGRTAYTHVAIAILSVPKRELLITGADFDSPAPPRSSGSSSRTVASNSSDRSSATSNGGSISWAEEARKRREEAAAKLAALRGSTPEPVELREARTLPESNRKLLDRSLLAALKGLSDAQKFDNTTIPISLTPRRVRVLMVEANNDIVIFEPKSMKSVNVKMDQLKMIDKASLSILISQLQPESANAKAMAAVYLEAAGKVQVADKYFAKAGEAASKKLSALLR